MQYTTLWFLVARNIHVGATIIVNYCCMNDLMLRWDEEIPIGRKRARNLEQESRKKLTLDNVGFNLDRRCPCGCVGASAKYLLRNRLTQRPLVALAKRDTIAVQAF